jgi:putative serine protease PepD
MTEDSPWKAPEQPTAQDTVPVFAGPVPPATPPAAPPPAAEQPATQPPLAEQPAAATLTDLWGPPASPPSPPGPTDTIAFGTPLPETSPTAATPTEDSAPRSRRGRTAALVASTALVAGLLGGGIGGLIGANRAEQTAATTVTTGITSGTTTTVQLPKGSVAEVAATVGPSVVSIQFRNSTSGGEGSGVILTSDGKILTNNHVVEGAVGGGSLTVTFSDGKSVPAKIIGRDPSSDLAVIQAENVSGAKPATLGSSATLVVGESVVAIGSPLGLSGTVTSGIVSALNRPVTTGTSSTSGGAAFDAIQTDAAINPGNSGGALANLAGQVVGINSAIATLGTSVDGQSGSIGLGFSIPIDQAKRIADELIKSGTATKPQLGVTVGDAPNGGAQIGSVTAGGAAAQAGLKAGDVITSFGGRPVEDANALVAAVRSSAPGSQQQVVYVRGGKTLTTTVTLESVPSTTG